MPNGFRISCVELVMTWKFLRWPVAETVVNVTFFLKICLLSFVFCVQVAKPEGLLWIQTLSFPTYESPRTLIFELLTDAKELVF